jgi:hypothetical protein
LQIYSKLAGQFGQSAIDNALHSLTSEAHLYTTTGTSRLLQLVLMLLQSTNMLACVVDVVGIQHRSGFLPDLSLVHAVKSSSDADDA